MRSVPFEVLSLLNLDKAARREADAAEPLIPSSPGATELRDNRAPFVSWLGGQLRAGMPTCRGLVVAIAKPVTGSRPAAIWGFAERVTYRALTDLLMGEANHKVDRSPERYREFISAPMAYAEDRGTRPDDDQEAKADSPFRFVDPWPAGAIIQYVVKADLASFYDYVDHDILGRELLIRTGDHAAVECLLDLLGEVQGQRFGLPQLLEPSDRLSGLYAGRVLRALRLVPSTTRSTTAGSTWHGCGAPWRGWRCPGRGTGGWCWRSTSARGYARMRAPARTGCSATSTAEANSRRR